MAIHDNHVVDVIKLKNDSATVCNLQVCYKVGENGDVHNAGKETDNFPNGQESYLRLADLTVIPDGAYVTARADVKGATTDKTSEDWVVYKKGAGRTAKYSVSGSVFEVHMHYNGLEEKEKAEYKDNDIVDTIKLKNESGTVCNLQVCYRIGQGGEVKNAGVESDNFPNGQESYLRLADLTVIPDGAYVTARADVKGATTDKTSEVWVVYKKGAGNTAKYSVSGSVFEVHMHYNGIEEIYKDEKVASLKLLNQSGTVCALECYYKVNKNDNPQRIGKSDSFPVGQTSWLNLDDLTIPNGAYVTAYANVTAGTDSAATTWLIYEKGEKRIAKFQITGVINFTDVLFIKTTGTSGTLTGYAVPTSLIPTLDHTYVYSQADGDDEIISYPCWGGNSGGKEICKGKGNVGTADDIAGDTGTAGILYAVTGVCHQTANRILYPAHVLVNKAKGYSISCLFYGDYGRGFNPSALLSDYEQNSYFGRLQQIMRKYDIEEQLQPSLAEQQIESFSVFVSFKLGDSYIISEDMKSILKYIIAEKNDLDNQLDNNLIDLVPYALKINTLANSVLSKFADILSDNDYISLFDLEKGKVIELVDINQLQTRV